VQEFRRSPYVLAGVEARGLRALAASADGATIYFVGDKAVWSVPADGSRKPSRVAEGDGVAVHPNAARIRSSMTMVFIC
jgi:hypothetical protein